MADPTEQIRAIFSLCDQDGRGWITPQQLGEAFQLSYEDLVQLCKQLGTTIDGQVTFEQFVSCAFNSSQQPEPQHEPIPESIPQTSQVHSPHVHSSANLTHVLFPHPFGLFNTQ